MVGTPTLGREDCLFTLGRSDAPGKGAAPPRRRVDKTITVAGDRAGPRPTQAGGGPMKRCLLALVAFAVLACGAEAKNPVVVIKTNHGTIKVELFEKDAPETVKNF